MLEVHFTFFLFLCIAGNVMSQKMPRFSWGTIPVAHHGCNTSAPIGMYSPESLRTLAKFAIVTLEKWQGINGFPTRWDKCQNGTNVSTCGCCTEDNIVAVAKEIKKVDPTTMVVGYWHSNKEYPIYRHGQVLCKHSKWWARDENGTVQYSGTWVYWDHSIQAATDAWADGCLSMTNTGYVDGCFMDGCTRDECNQQYNPDYLRMKEETMVKLQTKTSGPLICGSNGKVLPGVMGSQIQNWGKGGNWSAREIPMIMKAVDAGIMFQAHGPCPSNATDPKIITNIAAFLIGAGPWSYYMCGSWTSSPQWFPIYDYPLGMPLSNATQDKHGVWRRSFKSGTKVTFDTKKEVGTIDWGTPKSASFD